MEEKSSIKYRNHVSMSNGWCETRSYRTKVRTAMNSHSVVKNASTACPGPPPCIAIHAKAHKEEGRLIIHKIGQRCGKGRETTSPMNISRNSRPGVYPVDVPCKLCFHLGDAVPKLFNSGARCADKGIEAFAATTSRAPSKPASLFASPSMSGRDMRRAACTYCKAG